MKNLLKRIVSLLPRSWKNDLRRRHFARQVRKGRFVTGEEEFPLLEKWVQPGDWVLDIGANVGHYTKRLSEIVGAEGRVIAFEPVPETFRALCANTAYFRHRNLTLLNIGAMDRTYLANMKVPRFKTGLDNYYMATVTDEEPDVRALCVRVDDLGIKEKMSFVKIDVENQELAVLKGMRELILRDRPVLLVEDNNPAVVTYLEDLGYGSRIIGTSHNRIYSPLTSSR